MAFGESTHETWVFPVAGWEAATQHIWPWSDPQLEARDHSAQERFGITLLVERRAESPHSTSGKVLPPFHCFWAQAGTGRHFGFGAGQL